jgi:hypothetical protein
MTDEDWCLLCCDHGHRTADCPHREGECPMCGESYTSYVGHLRNCRGGAE